MKKIYFVLFATLFAALTAHAKEFKPLADFAYLTTGDELVITMTYNDVIYALNGDDATGKSPLADVVELKEGALEDPDAKYVFFAEPVEGGWLFTRADGGKLNIIATDHNVRVGTPSKSAAYIWNLDTEKGYLYAELNGTNEYLGAYHKTAEEGCTKFAHYPYSETKTSGWKKLINDETLTLFVNSPTGDPSLAKHTITVESVEGGTISSSYPLAGKDALIEVTVSADKGYYYVEGSLRLTYNDGTEDITTIIEDGQFLMPDFPVTITAEFEGRSPMATIDFTDTTNPWQLPESRIVETQTFANASWEITVTGTGNPEKTGGYVWSPNAGGYLLIGRRNAVLSLPVQDHDITKIVTTGKDGASAQVEMNIFVDGEPVSSPAVGSQQQNIFLISRDHRAAGTQYDIIILNDNSAQFTAIDFYADVANAPETPVAEPAAGIYKSEQTVSLTCETEDAEIFYTLDGSRPTETATPYSSPILVDQTMTIRAIAIKDDIKSEILTASYAIAAVNAEGEVQDPYSVADVHLLNNPGWKAWVHGFVINGFDSNIKVRALSAEATNAIAIADQANETDMTKMSFVELPLGKVRNELNVVAHPENIGKEIWVYGVLSNYGGQPGVSKTSKYFLDEVIIPVDTATPLPTSEENTVADKFLIDGQLLILRQGIWYNAAGIRVK